MDLKDITKTCSTEHLLRISLSRRLAQLLIGESSALLTYRQIVCLSFCNRFTQDISYVDNNLPFALLIVVMRE